MTLYSDALIFLVGWPIKSFSSTTLFFLPNIYIFDISKDFRDFKNAQEIFVFMYSWQKICDKKLNIDFCVNYRKKYL